SLDTFAINEPLELQVSDITTDVVCNYNTNGSVDLTLTGGTPAYTFNWQTLDGSGLVAGAEDQNTLTIGTYDLTVTDDHNCTYTSSYSITGPDPMIIYTSTQHANCAMNNGMAWIDSITGGGTAPYQYVWSNASSLDTLYNVVANPYQVTVTTSEGCTETASVTINNVDGPQIDAAVLTHVSCNGLTDGAVNLTISGGTPTYTYSWTGGSTDQDLAGLPAGTYDVTITDAASCSAYGSYEITEPDALQLLIASTNVGCYGDANGSADITVSGGTPSYSYNWSGGNIGVSDQEDYNNLIADWYYVTVTDGNGCEIDDSIQLTEPSQIVISSIITDVDCYGNSNGLIDLTVSGGNSPYDYTWLTNDGSGLSAGNQDQWNLTSGTYYLTLTDVNNCQVVDSFEIMEPDTMIIYETLTASHCNQFDGSIVIDSVTGGGATPYTYLWSNNATTSSLLNIEANIYSVTITSGNGCEASESYSIQNLDGPQLDTAYITDVQCYGLSNGELDLVVSGGVTPYSFNWTDGYTSEDLTGLTAGIYYFTITDVDGCSIYDSLEVNEPDSLYLTINTTDVVCYGDVNGAIDLAVNGGISPYSYSWDNAYTVEDLAGLNAGTYQVTVTDANTCTKIGSGNITEPAEIVVLTSSVDPACAGYASGSIASNVSGGISPYAFNWSNSETTQNISSLSAGVYTLTVTDANTC
ncbi:MAG: hypothetical protein C0594_00200, partial [Marinilabiliales bacterium]